MNKILVRQSREAHRYKIEEHFGREKGTWKVNATGKEVLDYIFGEYGENKTARFNLVVWTKDKRTPMQRFNLIWGVSRFQPTPTAEVQLDMPDKRRWFELVRIVGHGWVLWSQDNLQISIGCADLNGVHQVVEYLS